MDKLQQSMLFDPANNSKFREKHMERGFKNFLKILKFKHQKHVVLKQERTTAEDQEEKKRQEQDQPDMNN